MPRVFCFLLVTLAARLSSEGAREGTVRQLARVAEVVARPLLWVLLQEEEEEDEGKEGVQARGQQLHLLRAAVEGLRSVYVPCVAEVQRRLRRALGRCGWPPGQQHSVLLGGGETGGQMQEHGEAAAGASRDRGAVAGEGEHEESEGAQEREVAEGGADEEGAGASPALSGKERRGRVLAEEELSEALEMALHLDLLCVCLFCASSSSSFVSHVRLDVAVAARAGVRSATTLGRPARARCPAR